MGNIYYTIELVPKRNNGQKRFCVHLSRNGSRDFEDLATDIQNATMAHRADVIGIVNSLSDFLATAMMSGDRIHIKGLGYFSPSISAGSFDDPKAVNGKKIEFKGVNFRPDAELMEKIDQNEIHFIQKPGGGSLDCSMASIKACVKDYIEENGSISVREFQLLICQTRPTAYRRLRELCKGPFPFLKHIGPKNSSVFVLAKRE